jgi:hypothetical protein
VVELTPGGTTAVAGIEVTSWEVSHPSGAPPLALRLGIGGKTIAYTGDTAWTDVLVSAAAAADLLIAEAYYYDKAIPHHLRYADLAGPCQRAHQPADRPDPPVRGHADPIRRPRVRHRPRRAHHPALSTSTPCDMTLVTGRS